MTYDEVQSHLSAAYETILAAPDEIDSVGMPLLNSWVTVLSWVDASSGEFFLTQHDSADTPDHVIKGLLWSALHGLDSADDE